MRKIFLLVFIMFVFSGCATRSIQTRDFRSMQYEAVLQTLIGGGADALYKLPHLTTVTPLILYNKDSSATYLYDVYVPYGFLPSYPSAVTQKPYQVNHKVLVSVNRMNIITNISVYNE